jgi:hypothetical protein
LEAKVTLLDARTGPTRFKQRTLAHHLPGMLKQASQDIEGSASDMNSLTVPLYNPARSGDAERSERDDPSLD